MRGEVYQGAGGSAGQGGEEEGGEGEAHGRNDAGPTGYSSLCRSV